MMRTLVVDDDDSLRVLVRLTLQDDPRFEVVGEATNGRDAIALAQRTEPDLILLDLKMPVMDGFEALPALRQAVPDAQVVCLSMLQRSDVEKRVLALGANAFLDKSLPTEHFMARLGAVLWPRGAGSAAVA